ncbi:MAG: hypothetical protein WEB58_16480 [Planctomycetaceae bacterium]
MVREARFSPFDARHPGFPPDRSLFGDDDDGQIWPEFNPPARDKKKIRHKQRKLKPSRSDRDQVTRRDSG